MTMLAKSNIAASGKLDSLLRMYGTDECAARIHAIVNRGIADGDPVALELLVVRDDVGRLPHLRQHVLDALKMLRDAERPEDVAGAVLAFHLAYPDSCRELVEDSRPWGAIAEFDLYEFMNKLARRIKRAEDGEDVGTPLHELRATWAFIRAIMNLPPGLRR